MHTNVGRRVRDSWKLIETKEIRETVETNRDAHQCTKKSKRQWGTDRDQGDWRDQWIWTQVKKKVRQLETEGDLGDWRDCGDQWTWTLVKGEERETETKGDYRDYGDQWICTPE